MSSSPNESKALWGYLGMEESVDCGSDTSLAGDAMTMSDTPMSQVHPPTTLSPFAERDDVIVTSPLDEQQELAVQQKESARRHAQMVTTLRNQRDYVFTPPSVEERLRHDWPIVGNVDHWSCSCLSRGRGNWPGTS